MFVTVTGNKHEKHEPKIKLRSRGSQIDGDEKLIDVMKSTV